MSNKKYGFNFPKADGKYWFLLWIGRIHYTGRQKMVMLFFVNKNEKDDYSTDFNENSIFKTKVPVSYLSELHVGTLLCAKDKTIIEYKIAPSSTISLKHYYKEATYEQPTIFNTKYFKFIDTSSSDGIEYSTFTKIINKKRIPVFITPYCIAHYLFFHNDEMVNKTLSGQLLDAFKLNEVSYFNNISTKERVAVLPFDNNKLKVEDAKRIIPYLFLKNGEGIKLIKGIYSNLHSSLFNATNELKSSAFLISNLEMFSNYTLELIGKYHTYWCVETKRKKEIFIAYRVTKFEPNDKSFTVDCIDLVPFNSKNSTKDRDNHDKIDVTRPSSANTKVYTLSLNKEATNGVPATPDLQKTDQEYVFPVKVSVISRTEQYQSYNVKLYSPAEPEGISRALEALDTSVNILKEKIKKEFENMESISFFEYFNRVVKELYKYNDLNISHPLSEGINQVVTINGCRVNMVEIEYMKRFFYLIEFGKGYMGIFYSDTKLSAPYLTSLILGFIDATNELIGKQILWTYINTQKKFFRSRYQIEILTAVVHKRTSKDGQLVKTSAETIYNQRIKNNS